jgi:hypothetical protein
VGVGYGAPDYYGPPPAYFDEPPQVYAPAPPVFRMLPPDAVFDSLEERGYREFSPMAFRDGAYKLNAVNRRGDLVALEINVVTAEVMAEFILVERQGGPRFPAYAPMAGAQVSPPADYVAPPAPRPPAEAGDPLVVY